ncbi:TPA: hypothetical protein JBB06_09620 [Legionella pneumophila subsp. pneumophila]|uniref:hypothetical protein n=1 Tax=Legionella pneumophila TaxID=446 RepID=UPI000875E7ED|nr:hypothetical protein [Legionella pneumophila]AOW58532.1 hypothetical protein BE843_09840 [Legionella pneumophila subsp. pneumophila]AOW61282.1 hypothetical protein BE844_08925 [Legionella pneumophila subsp. pneumophila]AOW66681.1 hypothetical protein BE846_06695 [Legionella pneumophila subsp. pneumophila]HAT2039779.1 hypothetical protein [Legionella pneumophila]HAT8939766.1 hypothetical protein [Legionella pneumophila subsp. pneumophila]
MTRIFVHFPTPDSNNEIDLSVSQFLANELNEECIEVIDPEDIPIIPHTQTRVSFMAHGHRESFGFFDSPEQLFNYIVLFKKTNPHVLDIDLLACNVGLITDECDGFAQKLAENIDGMRFENGLALHTFMVPDDRIGNMNLVIDGKNNNFFIEKTDEFVNQLDMQSKLILPELIRISDALFVYGNDYPPISQITRYLEEDDLEFYLRKMIRLRKNDQITIETSEGYLYPFNLNNINQLKDNKDGSYTINYDNGETEVIDGKILHVIAQKSFITSIKYQYEDPNINLSFDYPGTNRGQRDEFCKAIRDALSKVRRVRNNYTNEENIRVPIRSGNFIYSTKVIRGALETFTQNQKDFHPQGHQKTCELYKKTLQHLLKLEDDLNENKPLGGGFYRLLDSTDKKIEIAKAIRSAKREVLLSAANYLLEPTSLAKYYEFTQSMIDNHLFKETGSDTQNLCLKVLDLARTNYSFVDYFNLTNLNNDMVMFEKHAIDKKSLTKDIARLKRDFSELEIKLNTFEEHLNEFKNSDHLNNLLAELINDYKKLKKLISGAERKNKKELYNNYTEIVDSFNIFKSDYRELISVLSEEEPEVVANMNSYT